MKNLKTSLIIVVLIFAFSNQYAVGQTMYKVTLFRAAPDKLLPLIENLKKRVATYQEIGGEKPYIISHSQGDQWDLMIYEHVGDYKTYYSTSGLDNIFTPSYGDGFYSLIAFHETIYSQGPGYEVVSNLFEKNNFFHVEMFVALPGKQKELLEQRKMENIYLKEINRNPNLIFTVEQGAHWDNFTLGGYRDIKHFAESANIPLEKEEKAALKAGFKGVMDISPYLRSLIAEHHDTLGGKVD